MKIKFTLDQLDKMIKQYLIPRLNDYRIFTFKGSLGAGKTTIIRQFLRLSGVIDIITSPTFNYLNIYTTKDGHIFNHFDLYRLDSLQSFLHLGFDEYLYQDLQNKSWCLIEWPEIIEPLLLGSALKKNTCNVTLNFDLENLHSRMLHID